MVTIQKFYVLHFSSISSIHLVDTTLVQRYLGCLDVHYFVMHNGRKIFLVQCF
ncbi:Uncharacterized protein TCM_006948 [Theobroma cacao]|uniref:Uncharacterized protein n=1 Tax=Theobroma cacao TaxID=3641 RepID=A0A061DZB8_THECC|nr:Uncharacterized protein TCM_006948 [Theobroma cacao]